MPRWPGEADVAVSLTFDVDAESGPLGRSPVYRQRLTSLSEGRYGIRRGLPRILALLEELGLPATFYVPGETALRHAQSLDAVLQAGHEIAHHGHQHLRSDRVSADAQRAEIVLGIEALSSCFGVRPIGYRSPGWELTPRTFNLLIDNDFVFDSSCMGDDRPYLEEHDGRTILELPVHWSLDDWPYFAWDPDHGGTSPAAQGILDVWLDEFDCAVREKRHVTYTMHPEIIGRGYGLILLRHFLETVQSRADVWFASHGAVAAHLQATRNQAIAPPTVAGPLVPTAVAPTVPEPAHHNT